MGSKRCRLYDENLVHSIMLSTGLSIVEYLRENTHADSDEVCDFVEANSEVIINDTIKHLKSMSEAQDNLDKKEKEDKTPGEDSDEWPINEDEE